MQSLEAKEKDLRYMYVEGKPVKGFEEELNVVRAAATTDDFSSRILFFLNDQGPSILFENKS